MKLDYRGKNVVIVGLGLTGLSCVHHFLSKGVTPAIMDTRLVPPGVAALPAGVPCCVGMLDEAALLRADLLVVSPGFPLYHPALVAAAQAGVEIVGDIELFAREAQAPIIAITGSNGKSTVTTWVAEMARAADLQVGLGGNIGIPALTLLNTPADLYVLELSSFQLETTQRLPTVASTILNVTEDHTDRYPGGLTDYCRAKQRIYQHSQICVVNAEDKRTLPLLDRPHMDISFGAQRGDYHFTSTDKACCWLCVRGEKLLNTDDMRLSGEHNYLNALAALALADAAQLPRAASLHSLVTFAGLPHRFQPVFVSRGVRWINDSKATNVGSTVAALASLATFNGTLWLLLGGDSKGADLTPLLPWLQRDKLRLFCFGQDGDAFYALRPAIAERKTTLPQAMHAIAKQVQAGDIVLLSPACASLDQFSNFEARGQMFTQLAQELG